MNFNRWLLGGARTSFRTLLPTKEVIRRLQAETDQSASVTKRPQPRVYGEFSGTSFRLVSFAGRGTAYRRKFYGKVEDFDGGSLVSGAFHLSAVVRGLLIVIVVTVWLAALATALQTRSIQPVGVAILVTVIGWVSIYIQMERSTDGEEDVRGFLMRTLEAETIDESGANR